MSILLDILPMVFSLIMGAYTEIKKQQAANQQSQTDALIRALTAKEKTLQSARKYETPHTSWTRKFIVVTVFASLFIFPMVLTLLNWVSPSIDEICILVPRELQSGGILSFIWNEGAKVEYVPLCGFILMPIHIMMAQIIAGFYFGQAGAKMKLV